jgi:hypothetical protein
MKRMMMKTRRAKRMKKKTLKTKTNKYSCVMLGWYTMAGHIHRLLDSSVSLPESHTVDSEVDLAKVVMMIRYVN